MRLVSSQQPRKIEKKKENKKISAKGKREKKENGQSIQSIVNSPLLYYISLNESPLYFIFFREAFEVKFLLVLNYSCMCCI